MTSQGSPRARFERALRTGNPTLVRAAAAELPRIGLDDALRICVVLAATEPGRYERAAVRWLGRLLLEEPGVTLAEAQLAATALSVLPRPELDASVLAAFSLVCEDRGLRGAARALAEPQLQLVADRKLACQILRDLPAVDVLDCQRQSRVLRR